MKLTFLLLGIFCAMGVVLAWAGTGADTGWTKTKVAVMQVDPVTELEYPEYQDKLILGVDFLVAGLIGSALLLLIGIFLPKPKPKPQPIQPNSTS